MSGHIGLPRGHEFYDNGGRLHKHHSHTFSFSQRYKGVEKIFYTLNTFSLYCHINPALGPYHPAKGKCKDVIPSIWYITTCMGVEKNIF